MKRTLKVLGIIAILCIIWNMGYRSGTAVIEAATSPAHNGYTRAIDVTDSQELADALLANGFKGDPNDHSEAIYIPDTFDISGINVCWIESDGEPMAGLLRQMPRDSRLTSCEELPGWYTDDTEKMSA